MPMDEVSSVLVSNLTEGLKQINQYLALGALASVSALALDRAPVEPGANPGDKANDEPSPKKTEEQIIPFQLVPMSREAAKGVLLGFSAVLGVTASFSAESVLTIVGRLGKSPELLNAACAFPSVATAPIGFRIVAAAAPVLLVLPMFWRLVKEMKGDARHGLLTILMLFAGGYATLALQMARSTCAAR